MSSPSHRTLLVTWSRLALTSLWLAAIAGCGGPGGPGNVAQRNAQDIAVQSADVKGLVRCSQSGKPDAVIQLMRNGNDRGDAEALSTSWDIATTNGGRDGYWVGYAASSADCDQYLFGASPTGTLQDRWVINYVVVFSSDKEAQAAWKSGLFIGDPDQLRSQGATVGSSTGLGEYSLIGSAGGGWLGIWSKGSSYSVLGTNYEPQLATQLAKTISGRM